MTAALLVDELEVRYGRRTIVPFLSLAPMPPGSVTALVGPNGAGKTTVLRALAGLVPCRGRLCYGETDLARLGPRDRARLAAYMPQTLPPGIRLAVLECLTATLRASPGASGEREPALVALAILERLGIVHLTTRDLAELSGGQRQMVSLAQTLVRATPLVFLDEPTSALDLHHQVGVMAAAREAAAAGAVVVVVLHDLDLAGRWCDRLVVLDGGRMIADGTPVEVLTEATLAAVWRVRARVERRADGSPRLEILGKAPHGTGGP